jgi:hypothetical protein
MDEFDYIEQTKPGKRIYSILWNLLTVLVLFSIVCLVAGFAAIFMNPKISFNPVPPPQPPVAAALPTLTPTAIGVLPATWTLTATATATETPPPPPPATSTPTNTPEISVTATETPTITLTTNPLPFELNSGSPIAISSLAFHPEAGCNWMGVAGQVLNMSGAPISSGVVVKLGGVLTGTPKDLTSLSGTATQYGDAGYEIILASKPIASSNTLWVQLLDQAGLPLSGQVYFDTYDSCDKNLIFINFRQVR